MTWLLWLLAPLSAICISAVISWVVSRPHKPIAAAEAISAHRRFLRDLADVTETSATAVPPYDDVAAAVHRGQRATG